MSTISPTSAPRSGPHDFGSTTDASVLLQTDKLLNPPHPDRDALVAFITRTFSWWKRIKESALTAPSQNFARFVMEPVMIDFLDATHVYVHAWLRYMLPLIESPSKLPGVTQNNAPTSPDTPDADFPRPDTPENKLSLDERLAAKMRWAQAQLMPFIIRLAERYSGVLLGGHGLKKFSKTIWVRDANKRVTRKRVVHSKRSDSADEAFYESMYDFTTFCMDRLLGQWMERFKSVVEDTDAKDAKRMVSSEVESTLSGASAGLLDAGSVAGSTVNPDSVSNVGPESQASPGVDARNSGTGELQFVGSMPIIPYDPCVLCVSESSGANIRMGEDGVRTEHRFELPARNRISVLVEQELQRLFRSRNFSPSMVHNPSHVSYFAHGVGGKASGDVFVGQNDVDAAQANKRLSASASQLRRRRLLSLVDSLRVRSPLLSVLLPSPRVPGGEARVRLRPGKRRGRKKQTTEGKKHSKAERELQTLGGNCMVGNYTFGTERRVLAYNRAWEVQRQRYSKHVKDALSGRMAQRSNTDGSNTSRLRAERMESNASHLLQFLKTTQALDQEGERGEEVCNLLECCLFTRWRGARMYHGDRPDANSGAAHRHLLVLSELLQPHLVGWQLEGTRMPAAPPEKTDLASLPSTVQRAVEANVPSEIWARRARIPQLRALSLFLVFLCSCEKELQVAYAQLYDWLQGLSNRMQADSLHIQAVWRQVEAVWERSPEKYASSSTSGALHTAREFVETFPQVYTLREVCASLEHLLVSNQQQPWLRVEQSEVEVALMHAWQRWWDAGKGGSDPKHTHSSGGSESKHSQEQKSTPDAQWPRTAAVTGKSSESSGAQGTIPSWQLRFVLLPVLICQDVGRFADHYRRWAAWKDAHVSEINRRQALLSKGGAYRSVVLKLLTDVGPLPDQYRVERRTPHKDHTIRLQRAKERQAILQAHLNGGDGEVVGSLRLPERNSNSNQADYALVTQTDATDAANVFSPRGFRQKKKGVAGSRVVLVDPEGNLVRDDGTNEGERAKSAGPQRDDAMAGKYGFWLEYIRFLESKGCISSQPNAQSQRGTVLDLVSDAKIVRHEEVSAGGTQRDVSRLHGRGASTGQTLRYPLPLALLQYLEATPSALLNAVSASSTPNAIENTTTRAEDTSLLESLSNVAIRQMRKRSGSRHESPR